ncbi:MAG: sugar phosphate isomerase/epimerase [Clostridiales bacterium]|jgi:sugar phosphate isomerase/epimerase|nr:sugar phosphate isomerase/epimerase [Clostridiales bacterium]
MFKISGFYDEASTDLDKQLELIKKLGGKYLCPRNINGKNISAYSAEEFESGILPSLKAADVGLSSIGSPIGKIRIDDEEAYAAQLKQLEELVKIAVLTDCKYIRCFSFFVGKNADYAALSGKVFEKFYGFVKAVEGTDITILHENEKKIFGDTPERALSLFHAVNHPQMKLCYDASNYIQCKADAWRAYEMTREYTAYYHMKDCENGVEVPLGTGQGRIREIVADLVKREYDGFLTLEPHTFKYAFLKVPFYLIPFLNLTRTARLYRRIDKEIGVKAFERPTREELFAIQYQNAVKIIDEAGGKIDSL